MVWCKNKGKKKTRKRKENIVLLESGPPCLQKTQDPLGPAGREAPAPERVPSVVSKPSPQLQRPPVVLVDGGRVAVAGLWAGLGVVVVAELAALTLLLHPRVQQLLLALLLTHE